MSFWLRRFPLLQDELITSWIVRLARQSGHTPYAFANLIFGSYWIWCRDTDLVIGDRERRKLATGTGIEAHTMHFHAFDGFDLRPERSITPGILSYGVYHRTRHRHGLQYCPLCLFESDMPYHRREWRFALQFGCAAHGVHLLDACPHCDAPLMPHRRFDASLLHCSECRGSLKAVSVPLTQSELTACKAVRQIFLEGDHPIGGRRVPIKEIVAATRVLFGFITSPRMPADLPGKFECANAELPVPKRRFDSLETSRVRVRAWAIPICLSMLDAWPDSFVTACRALDVSRTQVVDPRRNNGPGWFMEGIGRLPHTPRSRRRRCKRSRGKSKRSYKDAFQLVEFRDYLAALPDGKTR